MNKTEPKHTPGPWKYSTNVGPTKSLIVEPDGTTIFEAFNRTNDTRFGKNIAFMVDACNNYERVKAERDELARLLDHARHAIETVGDFSPDDISELLDECDATLAKLEDK